MILGIFTEKYAPKGLHIVGVKLDDDGDLILMRRFITRYKPVFPNYRKKAVGRMRLSRRYCQGGGARFRRRSSTRRTAGRSGTCSAPTTGTLMRRRFALCWHQMEAQLHRRPSRSSSDPAHSSSDFSRGV